MFGSRSLQLDERRQASRRSFEAWILTSRKVFSEESEWKSEFSYWLLKSEDNGSGKMAAHVGVNGHLRSLLDEVETDLAREEPDEMMHTNHRAMGTLVVRASDFRPEGLGSMPDATKYPPSTHGVRACSISGSESLVCGRS
ncbi:uncharacterized protein TNCV_2411721 [Trichonephila clavipes]|nr:uncharacterized protein TNCV_2411721 [Trichonephila clavipes]